MVFLQVFPSTRGARVCEFGLWSMLPLSFEYEENFRLQFQDPVFTHGHR